MDAVVAAVHAPVKSIGFAKKFKMSRSLRGIFVAALGLSFLEAVFAQSEELTPESQHHQTSQPVQDRAVPTQGGVVAPSASTRPEQDEAYSAAIRKCSEQSGAEQEQCVAETNKRFGRM